MTQKQLI